MEYLGDVDGCLSHEDTSFERAGLVQTLFYAR